MTQTVVKDVAIGTNLALYGGLMTMMSGQMLGSRGALIPALHSAGYGQDESMRIWQGLAHGSWQINDLLGRLGKRIVAEGRWVARIVGGYQVKALDTVGYFRPRLKGCATKHYHSVADKALPAINLGQLAMVGHVNANASFTQNVTVPCAIVRGQGDVRSEEDLMRAVCQEAARHLSAHDVVTADRKFSPLTLVKAGCTKVVLRRPKNITLRRTTPPPYCGRGRKPQHGQLVRPLARRRQARVIPASASDERYTWLELQADGSSITITANVWRQVVPTPQTTWTIQDRMLMAATVWTAVVIDHPHFDEPMLVLTTVALSAHQTYDVVCSRWGVEQPPLVAKQLLGLHRQFVWNDHMRFRYPELSLLAAGLLTYVAATVDTPTPTGWWDRHPTPTAGRLRRQLLKVDWRQLPRDERLRKKRSVTAHLPKRRPLSPPCVHSCLSSFSRN
jgi:hypothetical protein